jgi:predicted RNA binding protein YcfA (HicA-like mRNA interferase family)
VAGPFGPAFFMASKLSEIKKHLKKYGWLLVKNGTNHFIYGKDEKMILIPKGRKIYSRSYKQLLWKIEGRTDVSKERQLSFDIES